MERKLIMPLNTDAVMGGAPATDETEANPAADAAPATESAEGGDTLPNPILQIPEIHGLLQGKPVAISATAKDKNKDLSLVVGHMKELQNAGFGFYRGLDGQTNVIFNTQFVSPEQIQAADKAGKLDEIAPPFSEVRAAYAKVMAENPAPAGAPQDASAAPAAVPTPETDQNAAPSAPAPAISQKLASQRVKNMAAGAPSSGPAPGQGRIINSLAKHVI